MSQYAAKTSVPVAKTKGEIEAIVERYGAAQFTSGWSGDKAAVGFQIAGRLIRFVLILPSKDDKCFTQYVKNGRPYDRSPEAAIKEWEQACRQRWRALLLVIKAKLEAVECGISTIENEFLANIVLPGGQLVGDAVKERIAVAYDTGRCDNLLPDFSGGV